MKTTKLARGSWSVENDGATYATVKLMADYDGAGKWAYGWHVAVRGSTLGTVYRKGACHKTRQTAIAEATQLLSPK